MSELLGKQWRSLELKYHADIAMYEMNCSPMPQWLMDIKNAIDSISSLESRVRELEEGLRKLEFCDWIRSEPCCPVCKCGKHEWVSPTQHKPDCWLAALLKGGAGEGR